MTVYQLFNAIAKEWGKDPATLKKFADAFEEDFISSLEDLKSLNDAQLTKYGLPTGVYNRLKKKMAELDAKIEEQKETEFVQKECWIFY